LRFSVRNTEQEDRRKLKSILFSFSSFLILLFVLSATVPAFAQEDANARKFRLAESYLRSGQIERATNLLEDLVQVDPYSYIYFDRLIKAYVDQKKYDLAITTTERRLDGRQDQGLVTELAALHHKKGDLENAALYWKPLMFL